MIPFDCGQLTEYSVCLRAFDGAASSGRPSARATKTGAPRCRSLLERGLMHLPFAASANEMTASRPSVSASATILDGWVSADPHPQPRPHTR